MKQIKRSTRKKDAILAARIAKVAVYCWKKYKVTGKLLSGNVALPLCLLFLLAVPLLAQPPGITIQQVNSDPTGQACNSTRIALETPQGKLYTCQSGHMALASGGGTAVCVVSGGQTTGYVLTATNGSNGCSWQPGSGGGGSVAYISTVPSLLTLSVTAATHGQGVNPLAAYFDASTPAHNNQVDYSVSTTGTLGTVAFNWYPAASGYIEIWSGGSSGGTPLAIGSPVSGASGPSLPSIDAANTLQQNTALHYGPDGSLLPATAANTLTPKSTVGLNQGQGPKINNDAPEWMAVGQDGFLRFVTSSVSAPTTVTYWQCTDAPCSNPNIQILSNIAGSGGILPAVLRVGSDGHVRIAFITTDSTNTFEIVKFVNCTAGGSTDCAGATPVPVFTSTNRNGYALAMSLQANNNAYLVWENYDDTPTAGTIQLRQCTNAACSTSNSGTIVPSTTVTSGGQFEMIALQTGSDGFLRVAYNSYLDGYIHYVKCNNATCTSPTDTQVENLSENGFYLDLQLNGSDLGRILYQTGNTTGAGFHYGDI